jgi:3-oxoacyl-[acyl-carrier-protein] synthase-3
VLSNTENEGIIASHLNCIIDKDNALTCYNEIYETPFYKKENDKNLKVAMNGQAVLRFATRAFTDVLNAVVEKAGISPSDIKLIVPHQANLRIIKAAAKKMNIDEDKIYINIDKASNTSAATIPIALHEALEKNLIKRGDIILFAAFGAGLSSGAVLLRW